MSHPSYARASKEQTYPFSNSSPRATPSASSLLPPGRERLGSPQHRAVGPAAEHTVGTTCTLLPAVYLGRPDTAGAALAPPGARSRAHSTRTDTMSTTLAAAAQPSVPPGVILEPARIRKTPRRRLSYRVQVEDLFKFPRGVLQRYLVVSWDCNVSISSHYRLSGHQSQKFEEPSQSRGRHWYHNFNTFLTDSVLLSSCRTPALMRTTTARSLSTSCGTTGSARKTTTFACLVC